jgi:hypothetical protein
MIRKLVSRLNRSVTKQIVAARREFHVPIKISITPDDNTGRLSMPVAEYSIRGKTEDLSKTGIGFIVAAIRIKEYYLVGQDRPLNVEIDLPNGKVRMQMVGVRYEQINIHSSMSEFLVGAKIVKMADADREVYEDFLRHGNAAKKAGVLQLNTE